MSAAPKVDSPPAEWQRRLSVVVEMMREMSLQTDPQEMVRAYGKRIREIVPIDRLVSLSRRGMPEPKYRITRSSLWSKEVNPWKQRDQLPVLEGGLLGELIYGDEPRIIDRLHVPHDDPAAEYFAGQGSLVAIPNFEQGVAVNMVVLMREAHGAFSRDEFPELVWMSNLFGRATGNLVLSNQLRDAYDTIDGELRVVADIQRSLLPSELPRLPNLDIAAHYQTSARAGGDYYDFFPLPGGRLGILIADVSGHGTPAAVVMAITHTIAHMLPEPLHCPGAMLTEVNRHLSARYTKFTSDFVTAFYGIFDPVTRELNYACAGHNPPRVKSCQTGAMSSIDGVGGLPLGIVPDVEYEAGRQRFISGDQIIFYTDGITEAFNHHGEQFGMERLDQVLENCHLTARGLIEAVLAAVETFTDNQPATDDRTMLVARVL